MRRKLLSKTDVTETEIDELIAQLVNEGLLSDHRYAEAYIHMRVSRGYGPLRIREELKERGVAISLIEQYLDDNAELWHEKLSLVWQKRFNETKPKDFLEYNRQMRFLQYRGFDVSQTKAFFKKMVAF